MDLQQLLDGKLGVDALDAARELVALRDRCAMLEQDFNQCQAKLIVMCEAFEQKTLECAALCTTLDTLKASVIALVNGG